MTNLRAKLLSYQELTRQDREDIVDEIDQRMSDADAIRHLSDVDIVDLLAEKDAKIESLRAELATVKESIPTERLLAVMHYMDEEEGPTLIEDDDGDPYPVCKNCPDQIVPDHGNGGSEWTHVYETVFVEEGPHRHYLYQCQCPHDGKYGRPNVADIEKAEES